MSKGVVLVRYEKVYGVPTLYPINEAAKVFARIAGTKTLTPATMVEIKALGFDVAVRDDRLDVMSKLLGERVA